MAAKLGSFLARPWFYHYELFEREDGWWNAVIFAQGNLPIAMCEGPTRVEAECRGFNSLIYFSEREDKERG